jgi:dedicator of cytokinesis protein 3
MHNKHPKAQLLKTNTFPDESIQVSDAQYLQITAVTPEPDKGAAIFANPDVPTGMSHSRPLIIELTTSSHQGVL